MANARSLQLGLCLLMVSAAAFAKEKVEKIPVAVGKWEGPNASTFKGALKRGLTKECRVVGAKSARVVVEGMVLEHGKGFVVRVIVKQPKSGEVVEQKEFTFAGARASAGQSNKMGHAVAEIARRAPAE